MKVLRALCLIIGNVLLWSYVLALSTNNLNSNDYWVSAKLFSLFPLQGSYESVMSRSVLQGNQMHLDSFYGYEEIRSLRTEPIDRFDFYVFIGDSSYFDVFFAKHPGQRDGVRFSSAADIDPLVFAIDEDYKFSLRKVLPEAKIASGWHLISFIQKEDTVEVFCDQAKLFSLSENQINPEIAFRGSLSPVALSWVKAYRDGLMQWHEGFWGGDIFLKVLMVNSFVGFFLMLVFFLKDEREKLLEKILRWGFRILLLGLIWGSFDFFYYSRLDTKLSSHGTLGIYPTVGYVSFEEIRRGFFNTWLHLYHFKTPPSPRKDRPYDRGSVDLIVCENEECSKKPRGNFSIGPKQPNEIRILMVGGSMYQGSGVFDLKKTLFTNLFFNVEKEFHKKKNVKALNVALAGDLIIDQVSKFMKIYKDYDPDLIVTGFLNDTEVVQYEYDELEKFFQYTDKHHIPVIFLKSPHNYEENLKYISPMIRTTALMKKYKIYEVDLNNVTYNPEISKQGIIWWDSFHLTNYGQVLLGNSISPVAISILKK